jgi:multidrug efflux pump subunit AcrA (membrane-fusion protein)
MSIKNILNFIKTIFSKISSVLNFMLNLAWRFIVPIALIGLLIVPIALTYFPATKKGEPIIVKAAEKGNITKKITVQGTTEYSYSYDLPVYQDAELKEVFVKAGDKVSAGQVLANLEFVTENKLRTTSVENQIRNYQQEIANNNRALADAQSLNQANLNQMKVTRADRFLEINELYQKQADKINELAQKKINYQNEKNEFDRQITVLENTKDANDAIKQYQDKIDSLRLQLSTLDTSNANLAIQGQINSTNQQQTTAQTNRDNLLNALNNSNSAKNTICLATPLPDPNCSTATTNASSAQSAYNTANDALNNLTNNNGLLISQINNNNSNNSVNRNYIINQINDYQERINSLGNARLYEPNKATDFKITETAKTGRLQQVISELRADSNLRKTKIQAIEDNVELTPINEAILAKKKIIDELKATQIVNNETMAQTASGIEQRTGAAANNLNNTNLTLNDTIEDIQKQEKNKTITAKKDGVVGKVFNEKGLVVKSRDNQFTVVSDKYRLKFTVSADSRSQLKNGLKVIADKYPKLENITITEANLVPDVAPVTAATTSATVNYTIYADLPQTTEYNYTQGETVNVDVIINEAKDILYIPSTSVDKGHVYVGVDPTFPANKAKSPTKGGGSEPDGSIKTSSITAVDPNTLPTFKSAKKVKIKTGLDDNKNIQVLEGLKEGEWVFTIFPRTDKDRLAIKAPEEGETYDKPEEVNDPTSGIPDPEQ